jgi:glycosyltransferase involved in cell wall biosynthesis
VRVVIASTFVPFIKGGGTKIVEDLHRELLLRGIESETVLIPFRSTWRDVASQTTAIRLLDLTESAGTKIDRLIAIRTPSYALRHPNKVAWFIHHHRGAYDLWDTPWCDMPHNAEGRHHRDMMRRSDDIYLRECRKVFTNSQIVAGRVLEFNGLRPNDVLYPPLETGHPYRPGPFGDYLLYVSRLTAIKRQALAIEAMAHTDPGMRLVIAGTGDEARYDKVLQERVAELGLAERVRFTGWISDAEKAELTAGCCGALYLAFDEDSYGYSTLEAFHAHKPVITLTDSGGSLEVIDDGYNGLVCGPEPRSLADAMNRLWRDRKAGARMGENAHATLALYGIDWGRVIGKLLA